MNGILLNKVTIVTGAASGIGRASALLAAREGARVVLADLNKEGAVALAREINGAGGEAVAVGADVSREADVESMVRAAVDSFGRLDGAFNNAGIGTAPAPTGEVDLGEWERVLAVNLTGPMLCTKHEIRQMLKNGGGAIVNMASIAGLQGVPMQAPYSASKHGVLGLTKTAAAEYARAGIRVNAVCPGAVETPATAALGIDPNQIVPTPMGRIAKPGDVAEVVLWLLSSTSSFVTGQAVAVDGGRIATSFVPG